MRWFRTSNFMIVFPLAILMSLNFASIGVYGDHTAPNELIEAYKEEGDYLGYTEHLASYRNVTNSEARCFYEYTYCEEVGDNAFEKVKEEYSWEHGIFLRSARLDMEEAYGIVFDDGYNEIYADVLHQMLRENDGDVGFDKVRRVLEYDPYDLEEHADMIDAMGSARFAISSTWMVLGVLIGLVAFAMLIGVRALSTGFSDSTVGFSIRGVGLLGLWAVISLFATDLIMRMPLVGGSTYFGLTLMYALGVILGYEAE